ncbi:hypothetical protein ACFLU4_05275 [Chloroflexota bacterium]
MPKKISIIDKRKWLEDYESGKAESAIASKYKRDTRTVKKALEDARRERDAMFARAELMKEALRSHQDALKEELNRVVKNLESPRDDFAPLSWYEGDNSIYKAFVRVENLSFTAGVVKEAGRPIAASVTVIDLLRQHLKSDKVWKLLVQWEKVHTAHIADRVDLQRKMVCLLEQKTGYKLVDKPDIASPFIYSYTTGPILYKAILGLALGSRIKSEIENDIVADAKAGVVKYQGSILASAPGNEKKCRNKLLVVYKELLKSPELEQVASSYKNQNEWAVKVKQAANEIMLLGFIPGQCRVCKRLGM